MGKMDEVRQLVRQGKTSKDIIQLGYAPGTVYKVRRQENNVGTVLEEGSTQHHGMTNETEIMGSTYYSPDDEGYVVAGVHFKPAVRCPNCESVVQHWNMCGHCNLLLPQGCKCEEGDASLTEGFALNDLFTV